MNEVKTNNLLSFIEVKCAITSRENLGRPTISAKENKESFMNNMMEEVKS